MTQQFGKFEIKRVLGKGASGTVYLALDTFSGEDVALKMLDPALMAAPELEKSHMKQFMNEASLAGKLSHPHIASILEAALSEDSGYIVTEYVPGGDLLQFTSPGRLLTVAETIEIAFKSCGALDYAFRQGIVHRDIKPSNIMLSTGTNIKVTDFGAAYLHLAQETQITDIGSPLYMSPEQITSQPLTHHSDMFALGVVLYELLTGTRPFSARGIADLFRIILNDDPPAPSTRRAEISPQVDRFVMRMLSKSPADRYPTWADLALDIADIGRLSVYLQAIPDSEKFVSLRKIPLLKDLNDSEIWELVHTSQWRRVPSQTTITREGEAGTSLFFLAGGEAKVTRQGRLRNVMSSGEYFGELAYIKAGSVPRQGTVETITDALIAEFEPANFAKLGRNCQFQLTIALLHTVVDRLILAEDQVARP
ncbi:MAG: cyclic nucleotide-binding domain-containing protein [Betaproteobacteria bacterium]|nr:cyclic nucleotide-binding domain-containing protein [Betaproteobacteria bacterium]